MDDQAPRSQVYRQAFAVPFEYAVHFTHHVFEPGNPTFTDAIAQREAERRHRLFVVLDSGVADAWPDLPRAIARYCERHHERLELLAPPRVVHGGENSKNDPELVRTLQADMRRLRVDRQSFCVAIGGGAVLDLAGYAAATTHRGVRMVRLPTTVLAQNDSGVGVKNGVNAFGAKNFLGAFAPPFAVINDLEFLSTLAPRDRRAGLAEAVKVALIRDADFFDWLETHAPQLARFEPQATAFMVRRAAEIHMQHIATGGDPFELGSARPLDFGHWAAHRLETLSRHEVRHGEAVALGMALDCRYATLRGLLSAEASERVIGLLEALGFRLYHPALETFDADETPALLGGLLEFQEHLGGELTVTLLQDIGREIEVHDMDADTLIEALAWLRERTAAQTKCA